MSSGPTLISIIAHARAGALEHAWAMFRKAGLENIDDDAAVLSVHGRLLKDRALCAKGAERRRLYRKAADAYARAGAIDGGASYPLINAATLSLLAGERKRAQALAQQVLERDARGDDESETPYWKAATRAEALLLIGDTAEARTALDAAIALAPEAYEDHASTLRQFGLILDAVRQDKAWLDACRPPRALHFAGHMAVPPNARTTIREIQNLLETERVGFGYGALAAGSDILIAQALLERGAELHVVLPGSKRKFRQTSVAQSGQAWAKRFDGILRRATSVREIGEDSDPLSPLAIKLAAEVAMGAAIMKADVLMTEAVQLLILEGDARRRRPTSVSGFIGAIWSEGGLRQHLIAAPGAKHIPRVRLQQDSATNALAAMLRIDLSGNDPAALSNKALPAIARVLAHGPKPAVAPRWTGNAVTVAFDAPKPAAEAALSLAEALSEFRGLRIAGHYAIAQRVDDPFGGKPFLLGAATTRLEEIVRSTPAGAIYISADFATALHVGLPAELPRTQYVGELPADQGSAPVTLYSLQC